MRVQIIFLWCLESFKQEGIHCWCVVLSKFLIAGSADHGVQRLYVLGVIEALGHLTPQYPPYKPSFKSCHALPLPVCYDEYNYYYVNSDGGHEQLLKEKLYRHDFFRSNMSNRLVRTSSNVMIPTLPVPLHRVQTITYPGSAAAHLPLPLQDGQFIASPTTIQDELGEEF